MASGQDPLLTLLGANQQQQSPMLPQPLTGGGMPAMLPQGIANTQQQPAALAVGNPQQSPDVTAMMQHIMQQYQEPAMQKEMQAAGNMGPLTEATKVPPMSYQPNFQPMNSAGHVLGDVGKALLLGLQYTGPGQAVSQSYYQNRPGGVREYKAEQEQKAQRLEAAKAQSGAYGQVGESASRAIGGLAEADYRSRMAGTQERRTDIQQQKADQQGQRIANEYVIQGQRLAQGWDRLEQGQQKIAIQQWYDKGVLQAMNARIEAGMDQNSARIQAQEDMKAAATQSGFATKYPILGALMGAVGMSPDLTSAPAAGVPKPVNQPPKKGQAKAAAAGANVPAGAVVYDPNGRAHRADGTQPLPKGWSTKAK